MLEFEDLDNQKYIIIKITPERLSERNGSIYETVRKYWRIKIDRANDCPYVIGVLNGVVCCVYEVDKWFRTENEQYRGRCEFFGHEACDELKHHFMGKMLPEKYKKRGMANPIIYHD